MSSQQQHIYSMRTGSGSRAVTETFSVPSDAMVQTPLKMPRKTIKQRLMGLMPKYAARHPTQAWDEVYQQVNEANKAAKRNAGN